MWSCLFKLLKMKKLIVIITYYVFLFILKINIANAQNQYNLSPDIITIEASEENKVWSAPNINNQRTLLKSPTNSAEQTQILKLPYPVLFIHGLGSNSSTWDSTTNFMDSAFQFTFGGRFDFCLNFDSDNYTTNKHFFGTPGADIALFTPNIVAGDYYYVNFGVGRNGSVFPTSSASDYVLSEEQAIAKQGAALSVAINYVLQKTGRNKVILMGHSMGGLASREYLQNPENWQSDGMHHVAKQVTTGTPHGGSNSTAYGFGGFAGIYEESEAIRDLRRTYYYSLDSGVFLYGGIEIQNDSTNMDDNLGQDFYNVDVNCNGISGETIVGLNHKSIPHNIDYSCIIGECDGCFEDGGIGDGVVNDICANLNTYYNNLTNNVFPYNTSASTEIHTQLPSQHYHNMQGIDEPNTRALAYEINYDTAYTCFTTMQATGGAPYDYDYFKFTVESENIIHIDINNIQLLDLIVRIMDSTGLPVGAAIHSDGASTINFSEHLYAGNYYLLLYSIPNPTSYLTPFNFKISLSQVGIAENAKNNLLIIYPNPSIDRIFFKNIVSPTTIKLYTILGELALEETINTNTSIDVSQLEGFYTLVAQQNNIQTIKKVIIRK